VIGQGWTQVGELALAFVLATIGLERQLRQKSADRRARRRRRRGRGRQRRGRLL